MFDPGHAFRRAFSWLPTQFASQSDAPVGPRQFGSTEHLSIEALSAFLILEVSAGQGPSLFEACFSLKLPITGLPAERDAHRTLQRFERCRRARDDERRAIHRFILRSVERRT